MMALSRLKEKNPMDMTMDERILWNNKIRDLANLAKQAGAVLYLDARKATGTAPGSNSPLTNPLVDLTKNSNSATLTNFAGTTSDGYCKIPLLSSVGVDKNFVNLLGDDGNFGVDTNADGLADGWTAVNTPVVSLSTGEQHIANTVGTLNRRIEKSFSAVVGKKYYAFFTSKQVSGAGAKITLFATSTTSITALTSAFLFYGLEITATGSSGVFQLCVNAEVGEIAVKTTGILCTTDIFGAGNEPTKDQMDVIVQAAIAKYGYINTRILRIGYLDFLAADGVDSFGTIANNGSLDFVGTQDFAFTGVFVTPPVLQSGRILAKNSDTAANIQIGIWLSSYGVFVLELNGSAAFSTSAGYLKSNSINTFSFIRKSGTLKMWVNGVLVCDQANTTSLTSQPNIRLFARSNSADGTTQSSFFKGYLAILTAHGSAVTQQSLDKFTQKAFSAYLP